MLKNYWNVSVRFLFKNRTFALLNIIGLAVGITSCLLIFILIRFESSFDTFHSNKSRIYRVVSEFIYPEGKEFSPGVPIPITKAMRENFSQLEKVASIQGTINTQITVVANNAKGVEKKFREERGVFYVESEFFKIFDFPWISGNPEEALKEINTVALTQSTAEKYFGNWQSAIGALIRVNNDKVLKVTGIVKDPPTNTDFPFKVLISYKTYPEAGSNNWASINSASQCYILLSTSQPVERLKSLMANFIRKYKGAELAKSEIHSLQALEDIHFDERFGTFTKHTVRKQWLLSLALIAVVILVTACINFVNMATAQAVKRSQEAGIRKVLGSSRQQLVYQLLGETFLITVCSVLLSLLLAQLALPGLSYLLEQPVGLKWSDSLVIASFLLAITLLVSLLSGFYPALILSGLNPVKVLKSKQSALTSGGVYIRRALVITQFVIAQVLIISTLVVIRQMDYFQQVPMGFDQNAILMINLPNDTTSGIRFNQFRNQLTQLPGVKSISFGNGAPASEQNIVGKFKFNQTTEKSYFEATIKYADAAYFKTYDLKLVAGRPYPQSDTIREFIVNETLLTKMGIKSPQEALNKYLVLDNIKAPIIGVVKDFHNLSLRSKMDPIIFASSQKDYRQVGVKINMQQATKGLAEIQRIWNENFPGSIFESTFLVDNIKRFYVEESRISLLIKIFAVVAIFISCLGLYGLVSFMVVQLTKEIGVRKVLGASIGNILYLFFREFTTLVTISYLLAAPIGWYMMQRWLNNFAYRKDLGIGVFVLAMMLSLLIAYLTVAYKSLKASLINPITAIKTDSTN